MININRPWTSVDTGLKVNLQYVIFSKGVMQNMNEYQPFSTNIGYLYKNVLRLSHTATLLVNVFLVYR